MFSIWFQASDNAATKNQNEEFSNSNLPKSVKDTQLQSGNGDSNAATIKPDNANVNDNAIDEDEAMSDDDKVEEEFEYREDYDDSVSADDEQRFVLAPTPAQLGQAPKQRRMGSLVGGDAYSKIPLILYTMNSIKFDISMLSFSDQSQIVNNEQATVPSTQQNILTPTTVPSALPTPNSAAMDEQNPLSPNMQKKPFFKKAKGEDINK